MKYKTFRCVSRKKNASSQMDTLVWESKQEVQKYTNHSILWNATYSFIIFGKIK
jgi:hypothetical protein